MLFLKVLEAPRARRGRKSGERREARADDTASQDSMTTHAVGASSIHAPSAPERKRKYRALRFPVLSHNPKLFSLIMGGLGSSWWVYTPLSFFSPTSPLLAQMSMIQVSAGWQGKEADSNLQKWSL